MSKATVPQALQMWFLFEAGDMGLKGTPGMERLVVNIQSDRQQSLCFLIN